MELRKMKADEVVDAYEGNFADDMFEGLGAFFSEGTLMYRGYWRYGKKHGQGEFRNKQGVYEHGLFCNDELLKRDIGIY